MKTLGKLELEDSEWIVRRAALATLRKLEPTMLAQYADAVIAGLDRTETRIDALQTLGNLEPATLAQYAGFVIARLEDEDVHVRSEALDTLGKLEPTVLAQHAGVVIARFEDSDGALRLNSMQTLGKLEPRVLAQYASAVVARLADRHPLVRRAALATLGKLEPATLALHANYSLFAMLGDHIPRLDKDDPPAFKVICKLEPAALARHAEALLVAASVSGPAVTLHTMRILRRGLPRFVRHGVDFDDEAVAFDDLYRRLLARRSWYKLRLRLRVKSLAWYWYALPYRPSGPGHARDVDAWGRIGISSKRSRSE